MDKIALNKTAFSYYLLSLLILSICLVNCSRKLNSYASLDPQNEYVGTKACQPCHEKITTSYLQTGMGKSMHKPSQDRIIEKLGANQVVFDSSRRFYYRALWRGEDFMIHEFRLENGDTIHNRWEKVDYVVGSGHQTRSYLLERKGYIYEAPITWYVQKQIWDLSPGYDVNNARFEREIGLTCMACHTGHVDYVAESKNRYRFVSEGIDCEKCHGPGAIHIQKIKEGQLIDVGMEIDYSIVNPAKLPLQKQFDICQQCHLQGVNVLKDGMEMADFRPAMVLKELGDVFVEQPPDKNAFGIASHAQRLQESQCFIQSEGKLTCTTCHDPHKGISVTEKDIYIKQCESCHQSGKQPLCSENQAQLLAMEGNCISCHMPSGGTSDIPHVSFHDHKIRIVKENKSLDAAEIEGIVQLICGTDSAPDALVEAKAWLDYYETQNRDGAYLNEVKQRAPALGNYDEARFYFYQGKMDKALQAIKAILPENISPLSRFLEGEIAEGMGNYTDAFKLFNGLYEENQERWDAGLKAATNLLKARQGDARALDEAEGLFIKLQKQKPFDLRVKNNLAFIALNRRDYRKTERLLVSILNDDPDNLKALENMVYLQKLKGNDVQGRLYLEQLEKVDADYPGLAKLKALFPGVI